MAETSTPPTERNYYIDFLRAFSLLVVVAWHWVFTIVLWQDDGPHATSPIGFTTGLWMATWLLQVMPLFFYVGGYSHLVAWQKARSSGESIWSFVWRRVRRLAIPALALVIVWIGAGIALGAIFNLKWIGRGVLLVVSPLWFMGVYLMLIVMLPLFLWLHQRWDSIVLVFLVAAAGTVDILRFRYDWGEWLGLVNMIFVWGLCHQLGFFYDRLVAAARRTDLTLLWAGLAALAGLVASGIYPGSMVGVPGERSNMAPPTLCIVALVLFQAGFAEVIRPAMEKRLERPRWQRANDTVNRFSMPLFLFHTTGLAMYLGVRYAIAGRNEVREPTLGWWLTRPFAFIGPLLLTLPVIYLFGRQWVRKPRAIRS